MAEGRRVERWLLPAAAGVAAVLLGEGAAELTAAIVDPNASPITAIGAALIDLSPAWAKELAISLFGTADKLVLVLGIGVVLAVVAGAAGIIEHRRPPFGRLVILAGGVVGLVAVLTRANPSIVSVIPVVVATAVPLFVLPMLLRRLPGTESPAGAPDAAPSRRRFLTWIGGAAALGALATVGGYALQAGARAATAVRNAFTLPEPAVSAAPIPAGAELDVPGITPLITPNRFFYRIDTALVVPQVDPSGWKLAITGMVDDPFELTWDELIALPLEESITTLTCVSNPVGGPLIGNARWLGYPIRELLARAKPSSTADMVLSRSQDGFTASTPLEALTDERNAILAIGMNGEPLPAEHGFPVRMVVPGLYGYVSATKWVTELKVTRFDRDRAYWTNNGWSEKGPIKISCRIDRPLQDRLAAGPFVVAGVAWHQQVGISKVEVQVDGGDWNQAELSTAISEDTWVQWRWTWEAEKGVHSIRARATGSDGEVQTGRRQDVVPDGATGWHEMYVEVF